MTSDKQCSMNVMCFSISLSGTVTYPSNKKISGGNVYNAGVSTLASISFVFGTSAYFQAGFGGAEILDVNS